MNHHQPRVLVLLAPSSTAEVYHRDMKPSSLLLTTKLPDAVIKARARAAAQAAYHWRMVNMCWFSQ